MFTQQKYVHPIKKCSPNKKHVHPIKLQIAAKKPHHWFPIKVKFSEFAKLSNGGCHHQQQQPLGAMPRWLKLAHNKISTVQISNFPQEIFHPRNSSLKKFLIQETEAAPLCKYTHILMEVDVDSATFN